MEFEGLSRLEDIVGRLLSQYAELKSENVMLAAEVEDKKQELGRLQEKVLEMNGHKEEVHHRVSSILTKLEEWEISKVDSEPLGEEEIQEVSAPQESQKQLFNTSV